MEFITHILPNGIRCIHVKVKSSPIAHCAMTVGAGSRDELPGEYGLAHFIEHCLFKGTHKRRAFHINNRLDNLGGELNAFTTKEETVIHATTLRTDFPKAVELISDVLFNSTFPAKELDKERDIIIDEINSYKDSPAELIYDDFENRVFAGTSLGHDILGDKKSVRKLSGASIRAFIGRTYNTDQMVFSSVGSMSEKQFKAVCERCFGALPANLRAFSREQTFGYVPFTEIKQRGTFQTHCTMGAVGYNNRDSRRIVLSLLINILGGSSSNSLLNNVIREKNGLSYNVEAGYTPYSDTGIVNIYFGTEKQNLDRCIELINSELQRVCRGELSSHRISIAKKQFIGQLAIAMEGGEGYMLAAGKSILVYNEIDNMDKIAKKIRSISQAEINDVANEIFGNGLSTLIFK